MLQVPLDERAQVHGSILFNGVYQNTLNLTIGKLTLIVDLGFGDDFANVLGVLDGELREALELVFGFLTVFTGGGRVLYFE